MRILRQQDRPTGGFERVGRDSHRADIIAHLQQTVGDAFAIGSDGQMPSERCASVRNFNQFTDWQTGFRGDLTTPNLEISAPGREIQIVPSGE